MSQEQDASPTNVTSSSSTTAGATFSSGTEPTSDIPTTANSTTNNNNNNNRTKMADKDDEKSITFQPPRATTAAPLAFTSSGMVDSPVAVAKQNEPSSNDLLLGRNNDNIHTRARPRKDHETSETVRRKNTDPSQEPQRLPQLHHQSIGKVGSSSHGGIMKHTDEETSIFVAHSSQRPFAPSIRSQAKSETVGGRESMKSYRSTGGNRHLVKKNSAVSASVFSNLRSTMHERDRVLQEQKEAHKCCPVIFPWDPRYKGWWGFTVFGAIFTIFVETYGIAFSTAGLPEPADTSAILEYILYSIFLVDMLVNFDLAIYAEDGQVITQRMDIATNYFRFFFWVDFVGVFPFYPIALAVAGELGQDSRRAQYLSLLRLTRMVRLHRVKQLFDVLQLTSKISYLWLTLTRNLAAAVIWTHLAACTMYFISRQYDFDEDETMIGGNYPVLSPGE